MKMKTFSWKDLVIVIFVIVALVFCFNALANAEEKYKCFAELYPEKAEQANVPALGEIKIIRGIKIRVVAEAKNPEGNQWAQWVDCEPFDNVCDYGVSFILEEDGSLSFQVYGCDSLDEIIKQYCKEKSVDIKKYWYGDHRSAERIS